MHTVGAPLADGRKVVPGAVGNKESTSFIAPETARALGRMGPGYGCNALAG